MTYTFRCAIIQKEFSTAVVEYIKQATRKVELNIPYSVYFPRLLSILRIVLQEKCWDLNPGTTPVIPPLATTAIIEQTVREHDKSLRIWRQYNNVNAALKQQLISRISNIYIRTLQDRHTGFANISTRKFIEQLLRTYGNITPTDLAENDIRFKTVYDPSEPIEPHYAQLEDSMDYADAGDNAYTTNQVVSNAYTLVFNTGKKLVANGPSSLIVMNLRHKIHTML